MTLRCNAKCPFCSIHSLPESYIAKDMNTEQIKLIITQIAELGVNALSFTGGEPTLRKDLPELIHHAGIVENRMTGLATNGYFLPTLFKKNKMDGLDYILLSIDYPSADLHDKMRGIKVFDKAIESIKLANKRDIKVIISTVAMKDNLHLLKNMCELAEKLNCAIELYPCENIIRDFPDKSYHVEDINKRIPDINLWASLIRTLRTEFKNILTDEFSVEIIEKGGFGGHPRYHQKILRCHVAESYMFVRHDGFLDYPCKIHPIKSFNAFKYSISKIYNSKEVRDVMEKNDNFKFCNGCRLGCAIVSSLPTRWKTLYPKYIKSFLDGNLK